VAAVPLDKCPDEKRRKIDFPAALKNLLTSNGYAIPERKRFL
jgi:hypothetical protein